VTFIHKNIPTILAVPVNYQADPLNEKITGYPSQDLIGGGDNLYWGVWPLPDSGYPSAQSVGQSNWDYPYYRVEKPKSTDLRNWILNISNDLHINFKIHFRDALRTERLMWKPLPDYLFAWLKGDRRNMPTTDLPGGHFPRSSYLFGVAIEESQQYQVIFAHEMGHPFGFGELFTEHPNLDLINVGWDTLNRSNGWDTLYNHVKNPDIHGLMDIMTETMDAIDKRWVERAVYEPIIYQPISSGNPVNSTFLLVGGVIPEDPGEAGYLLPSVNMTNNIQYAQSSTGPNRVRIVDQNGVELYSAMYTLDSAGPTYVSAEIPYSSNVHAIELYRNGVLEDTITRSPSAPTVTITSPAPGENLDSSTIVRWSMSDADGDALQSYVQYSHDGGITWRPLARRIETEELALSAKDDLPAGTNAIIKVIVSDGLNTTEAQVETLQVQPNHPPQVRITSLKGGQVFESTANVILGGVAYDLEDGAISDWSLVWTSNIDGLLGTGPVLNKSLSIGVHTITLFATDNQGATTNTSVVVTIN